MSAGRHHPVDQRLEAARRARPVRAAVHRLALRLDDLDAAERAVRRHPERLRPGPVRARGADDLRDHVAGALDDHVVARADLLAVDVLLVVEGRARDGDAADLDRLEHRPRVERAGAADADPDLVQARHGRQRRPLERARPARAPVQRAEPLLLVERVDLDHDPVDLVVELGAGAAPRRGSAPRPPRRRSTRSANGFVGKPRSRSQRERVRSASRAGEAVADAGAVDPDRERPLRRDRRVLLPQRAGGGVARVRPGRLVRRRRAARSLRGSRRAACRPRRAPRARRAGSRPRATASAAGSRRSCAGSAVTSSPLDAVAAGLAADEDAVLVDEVDRRAVDLRLDHVGDGSSPPSRLRTSSAHLTIASSVVTLSSEPIGVRCRTLLELLRGRRADPPGRRVGRDELGVAASIAASSS